MSNPGQRNVIIGIVVAVMLGLAVAAVIAGLLIGFVVRPVSEGGGDVSFRTITGEDIEQDFEEEGYGQADRRLSLDLSVNTGVISIVREE